VFEHSPWVASRAACARPFATKSDLHAAMIRQVELAAREEQLLLLRAHPDLGARARMSEASLGEQAGAGLDRLTRDEFDRFTRLNENYKLKFGFPFLFAVKGSAKLDILAALETRLQSSPACEYAEALRQVYRIAGFRLADYINEEK
jgi:2-oxo-4-hydroxy-4-carboxy-5-ureidoimidazoline decarboxylase